MLLKAYLNKCGELNKPVCSYFCWSESKVYMHFGPGDVDMARTWYDMDQNSTSASLCRGAVQCELWRVYSSLFSRCFYNRWLKQALRGRCGHCYTNNESWMNLWVVLGPPDQLTTLLITTPPNSFSPPVSLPRRSFPVWSKRDISSSCLKIICQDPNLPKTSSYSAIHPRLSHLLGF